MKAFDYLKPASFAEASRLLVKHGARAKILAGGTDLIVRMRDHVLTPGCVVDIKGIPGGDTIEAGAEGVTIGFAATLNAIASSTVIKENYFVLSEAAHSVGSYQVRNRATLAGNLCNASPAADTAPALLVLEASVLTTGPKGDRKIPIGEFFTGPGRTVLEPGEIVKAVNIPAPGSSRGCYIKHSRRKAVDLATVGVAVLAVEKAGGTEVRIALGAVAPTPIRAAKAEAILAGDHSDEAIDRAAAAAADEASPITDLRGSKAYRTEMIRVLTRRALRCVLGRGSCCKGRA